MIQNTPIQKLEADIQQCSSLLEQAKLDLKIANSRDQKIMSIRIQTRINYFERRITVSKSELNRFKALYSMSVEDQTKARLISANKFNPICRDVLHTSPIEASPRSLSGVEVNKGEEKYEALKWDKLPTFEDLNPGRLRPIITGIIPEASQC